MPWSIEMLARLTGLSKDESLQLDTPYAHAVTHDLY